MREVEIPYEGETVKAQELDFTTEADNWGQYKTEQGFEIRMRNVVSRVYRLVDKTRDDGSPIHVLMGSVIMDTSIPSNEAPRR